MLEEHSDKGMVLLVALLRLPYLGSGLLNYLISMSSVHWKQSVLGNALGLVPGAVLFTVLGGSARSLLELVSSGNIDTGAIVIIVLEMVLVIASIAGVAYVLKRKRRAAAPPQEKEEDKAIECTIPADHNKNALDQPSTNL
jgi:uncharacterized membrane protein YdjX (TVP38/TMEM64 family)